MARQLPVPRSTRQTTITPRAGSAVSAISRTALSLAPELIRAAERLAVARMERRQQQPVQDNIPAEGNALHLSEVEIDFSLPFVRKVTMRNATAWSRGAVVEPKPKVEKRSKLRKAGLLGASGAIAVMAGIVARKIGPLADDRKTIIDVGDTSRD